MTGVELVTALEAEGFFVERRSSTVRWLRRGEQTLMLDTAHDVDDAAAARLVAEARGMRRLPPP